MSKILRFAPALLAPLFLLACGEAGQTDGADTAAEAGMEEAAEDTTPRSGSIQLEAKNQSGITGEAYTEAAAGDSAVVILQLQGLDEGEEYPAHVHQGTCEEGGPVAVALDPVTGEAGGTGASRTTLSTGQFAESTPYFVQVHLPDGTPASCVNVPATASEGEAGEEGGDGEGGGQTEGGA